MVSHLKGLSRKSSHRPREIPTPDQEVRKQEDKIQQFEESEGTTESETPENHDCWTLGYLQVTTYEIKQKEKMKTDFFSVKITKAITDFMRDC